ncbi:MAG: DUF6178 family protein [Acidobacteriota bacterium]
MPKRGRRGLGHSPDALDVPTATTAAIALPRSSDVARSDGDASRDLFARLLGSPDLARIVPHLPPESLHQIIRQAGLEACGELMAAARPEQLAAVLDLDVWNSVQPGSDDRLDVDRFGDWLDVLVETGEDVAARTVAAMDPNLVIAGLARFVRVFDVATVAPTVETDDELVGPEARSRENTERAVGGYLLRAIGTEIPDAIVTLLLALDADHQECFQELMRGCRSLSNSAPEVDGLDNILTIPEQQMHDVALARERRQSRQGYSTPAHARAFLQMARQRRPSIDSSTSINPIVSAYLQDSDPTVSAEHDSVVPASRPSAAPLAIGGMPEPRDSVVDMFVDAVRAQGPRGLLEGSSARETRLTHIRPLMEYVRDNDDAAYYARGRELAFLANTLAAGCSVQSRAFTPQEASDAAIATCNLGLEQWAAHWLEAERREARSPDAALTLPSAFLVDHDLVTAFELGWAVLHEQVCMFAAEQLTVALKDLRSVDVEIQQGLRALRKALVTHRATGMPWKARGAIDAIALLDLPAWTSLLGLIDECPVIPAALTAVVEHQVGAVSATAFEFIATTSQIGIVRQFMALLPETLRR